MNRAALCFFAVFASACGLVHGDEALAPFPSDGIGAFEEASPIEVCLGTARVIAPAVATGATALCVPTGQKSRLCAANADCTGIERCICGRCIVEPCQGGTTCSGDEVCRGKRCTRGCGIDADCNAGERCISGGCARSCKTNTDCHYGERCDALDDVCVVSLCGSGGSCGSGSVCEPMADIGELHEPNLLGDESIGFVELKRNGDRAIYRASLEAPQVWRIESMHPVIDVPGETLVGAPSVIRRDNVIELYAAAGNPSRIVRARSNDDGVTYVLDTDPVLVAIEPWENGSVGSPSVFDFQGATYMFYEGGARAGIGLAKITEGRAERIAKNPILSPQSVQDPIFWRQVTHVGAPHAMVVDDSVRLIFTARGVEGFSATTSGESLSAEPNDSIGLATSTDLKTFTLFPAGPVYARLVNLRAYLGEGEATVRLLPSGAEMVFVSSDASGEASTGLMRVLGRGGVN
ncbi:MAG: hypothetical protein IPM54_43685 [Polyangiaceae bacterium]|nr:hypothetical protein [Polyangiaceae bacterium]